jgi:rod shape-determining protein MreC
VYGSSGGRRLLASALIILCIIVLVNKTAHVRVEATFVERAASDIMGPLQDLASRLFGPLTSATRDLVNLRSIRQENELLKEKLGSMPLLEAELKEARMENERLREMLKFAASVPSAYVPAVVIARNSDNWLSTFVINKGSSSGIQRDDPVVTSAGLVGRVIKVSARTSTVMLVVDPDSGAGGLVQRSRDSGVVVGQVGMGQMLKMKFFSRDSDVQVGDVILTSGLGSLFPKGLPMGTVISVGRGDYGLVKTADVVPFVNFDRVEEVLVLKGYQPVVEEGGH